MPVTYRQETKNNVRHAVIKRAVELLTTNRSSSCCVRRSYVRDLYDFFIHQDESHEQSEALKIDLDYIREWEHMHTDYLGYKRPTELSVCYLSGPEPENDFNEFLAMGILPQNIWAFESERGIYLQALSSIDNTNFLQPKLVKTSIERFFENTPKKFDIVYIDACAPIVSDQHSLRCIASMFKYHRLNSPGVLISNFAGINQSNGIELNEFHDIISRYFYLKRYSKATLIDYMGKIRFQEGFSAIKETVWENFEQYYGDFITSMICNVASISIPTLRFANSNFLQYLSKLKPIPDKKYDFPTVNTIQNNTLLKYLATNRFLEQMHSDYSGITRINKLEKEISAGNGGYDLLSCSQNLHDIRINGDNICLDLESIMSFFDNKDAMYQFLDKPNRILFFDAVINQLSYPMHYCSEKATRLTYIAKQTRMFTDLMLFDECRYIYDWIPAIHQIPNAFSNPSWQYTFRFALDGLVKQRINYNNEFFFQGSVVGKNIKSFEAKQIPERKKIN